MACPHDRDSFQNEKGVEAAADGEVAGVVEASTNISLIASVYGNSLLTMRTKGRLNLKSKSGGGKLPSMFKVNVVARNPKREELATPPVEVLVDTGSELTLLPKDVLAKIGITLQRKVGHAILAAE